MTGETHDEERARAVADSASGDPARAYGSADETEKIMTGEDEPRPERPTVRPNRDPSEPRGWPGEDSAGQRADG